MQDVGAGTQLAVSLAVAEHVCDALSAFVLLGCSVGHRGLQWQRAREQAVRLISAASGHALSVFQKGLGGSEVWEGLTRRVGTVALTGPLHCAVLIGPPALPPDSLGCRLRRQRTWTPPNLLVYYTSRSTPFTHSPGRHSPAHREGRVRFGVRGALSRGRCR